MLFHRFLTGSIAAIVIVVSSASGFSDITIIQGRDIQPRGTSPVGEDGQIYKISITPAAETVPAFKYRLCVPPHETVPGNAVTHYLRSLGEGGLRRPWEHLRKETEYEVDQWASLSTPESEIPLDQLKNASEMFDSYVQNHLRRATLCREADWGIAAEDLKGMEAIGFLLPSVQSSRDMIRALLLQHRLALIEDRFGDAVDRLRMAYQLAHNFNEMGFLVSSLVAASGIGMVNDAVLLFTSTDDSPNLYWALAELPDPVVDLRKSGRLDSSLSVRLFPELIDIETKVLSEEQWNDLLLKYLRRSKELEQMVSGKVPIPSAMVVALAQYTSAKARLLERGYEKQQVESMPVAQVILIDAAMDLKYFSEMNERSWYLPKSEAKRFDDLWEAEVERETLKMRAGAVVVGLMAPSSSTIRAAAFRSQANVNLLMAIESLRNHAAIHGRFPKTLAELDLPVRDNPMTDKPFDYSLQNGTAVITLDIGRLQRYEISINDAGTK